MTSLLATATIVPNRDEDSPASGDGGDRDDIDTSRDTLFFLLQNRRRRYAISALKEMGGEAEFKELVRRVGAKECGVDPDELGYSQRKSVHTSLYQVHLPKLEEAGVVHYDQRRGYVELSDQADVVFEYLDMETDAEDTAGVDWSLAYGAVALAGSVLVLLDATGTWPMNHVPALGLATAFLVAFYVLAFAQRR